MPGDSWHPGGERILPRQHGQIGRAHAASADAPANLARPGLDERQIHRLQHLGPARSRDHHRAIGRRHRFSPCSLSMRGSMAIAEIKKIVLVCSYVIHFRMTQREPGWELFRTFLEVARDGSLSGAARKLGLTQPTVGRHIDALEAALGLALFTRPPQGLTPTPSALELVDHAEAMSAASAAPRRTASGGAKADRRTVPVTASQMI